MKNLVIIALIIFMGSCKKEIAPANNTQSNGGNPKEQIMVVYANNSCPLANGTTGCRCEITTTDDDCSLQTDCKASGLMPHYEAALNSMFTPAQIQQRAIDHVRITETVLKDALRLDGYPLKP